MPFHHIDQQALEAARRTILQETVLREAAPLLLQHPAPEAPPAIAVLALTLIRCWTIRTALRQRFSVSRRLPASAISA
jgi:hypothetical protein